MRRDVSNAVLSTDAILLNKHELERNKNIRLKRLEKTVEILSVKLDNLARQMDEILADCVKQRENE